MFYQNFVRLTLAVLVFALCTAFSNQTYAETPQEWIQRYSEAINANPNDCEAYNKRGIA